MRRVWFAIPALFTFLALTSSAVAVSAAGYARLSTDVAPVFQRVHLRCDSDSSRYTGWITVDLDVRKPTSTVTLHAEGQDLERLTLTQGGKAIAVKRRAGEEGMLFLAAARPLATGKARLEIHFKNAYNTQAVGLYRVQRGDLGYLFTQFESADARKAFPCWDEPGFKFPYQITLVIPERERAVTNTPIASQTARNGWKTIVFEKTPPLPSYLLAIAVGQLEFVDVPGTHVPTRVVTVKGQSHLAGLAVAAAPPVIAALEAYFDMPYPYRKLDLIAVPEYWYGAMENPGAIVFTESSLLLDPASVSMTSRRTLTRFLAHELAHMWFGDLVTMAWWDDLWLNEAFADWMGDKITEQVAPQFELLVGELPRIEQIMETDARPTTEPIHNPGATPNDAMRSVGLAYFKGKAVLGMFERWIGPDVFRRGVNQYLRAHEWKNAVGADLWAALGEVSGKDVAAAMAGYIDQQGLPLVTVDPQPNGSLRLTQRRFLNSGVKAEPLSWKIPMAIKWSDGAQVHTQRVLVETASTTVALQGGGKQVWVMPNGEARGYYRWTIPQRMMLALSRDAATSMTPAERIAFIGNASALLAGGELHGDAYLRVLADFSNDPDPLVASELLTALGTAQRAFVSDDLRDVFGVYVRRTLGPMARRFGLEKKAGEADVVSLLRPDLLDWLGDEGRDPEALAVAARLAAQYVSDPAGPDPSLAGRALELRAIGGDRALFERYRHEFENARTPEARQNYLAALGRFHDPAIQDEAMAYVLQPAVRVNEMRVVLGQIRAQSDRANDRAFAWLREHYAQVTAKMPQEFQAGLPVYGSGCSQARIDVAKQFFGAPVHQVPGTAKQLAKVTEAVEDCVGLREREGAPVVAYLRGLAASNPH